MWALDVILNTWRRTEKPPKPKAKEHSVNWKRILHEVKLLIKETPFVTSIKPEIKLVVK